MAATPGVSAASSSTPKLDAPCLKGEDGKQAAGDGLPLVCTLEFGFYTWRMGPDEVSKTAHARFMDWVRPYVEAPSSGGTGFPVVVEPGYPQDVANAIIAAMDATKALRAEPNERAVIVLGTSPQWTYDQLWSVVAPYAARATQNERDIWEMENAVFRWRSVGQGAGHAGGLGGAPQVYFSYLSQDMGMNTKTTPVEAVEGMLREYLSWSPVLAEGSYDGNLNRALCWQGESTAWNATMAAMAVMKYPGFDFPSRWAHWVSDLAALQGAYQPGLAPSEKLISPQNGVNRYDMPCQWQGVGHTQGFLAREWLMANAGVKAYSAYAPLSRQMADVRAALPRATGVTWDRWYAESDARTAALLARYPASHKGNIAIGPDGQSVQTASTTGQQGFMGTGRPGAPVGVWVTRGGGRATMTWMHGSGDSAPIAYEWRVRPKKGSFGAWQTLPGDAKSTVIAPVRKGQGYIVQIRAIGPGGPSRTVFVVM